jgi:DNA-binding IscR family transcriptional regulator
VALAAARAESGLKAEVIAAEQRLPKKFVENILGDLPRTGFATSQWGNVGG